MLGADRINLLRCPMCAYKMNKIVQEEGGNKAKFLEISDKCTKTNQVYKDFGFRLRCRDLIQSPRCKKIIQYYFRLLTSITKVGNMKELIVFNARKKRILLSKWTSLVI